MPVTVYKLDGSPPCRGVNMVVELIGLKVQVEEVNTIAGDQFKPEYLVKNPLHTIPMIEDGEFILSDSHAIMTYLVSKYGADKRAELYPGDLCKRAIVDQRLYFDDSTLFPKFRAVMVTLLKDKAPAPTAEQVNSINEAYGFLEKYLERSPYLAADHLTLADVACVATVSTLDLFVPVDEKYPQLLDWYNKIKETSWYKKGNEPGLAMIAGFLKSINAIA